MRVIFLIDGFNLYHSVEQASTDMKKSSKWLDVNSLMSSYLQHIGKEAKLEKIYFFTAIRYHVQSHNPNTIKRHKDYLQMIKHTGVEVIMGKFKQGKVWCKNCQKESPKYEEKETDVNIAVKLVELAFLDAADVFVIVSGDTDLIPGVDVVNRQFPNKDVYVIFPYKRKNNDILSRVKGNFKIKKETYLNHQFPDPYIINKKQMNKPNHW